MACHLSFSLQRIYQTDSELSMTSKNLVLSARWSLGLFFVLFLFPLLGCQEVYIPLWSWLDLLWAKYQQNKSQWTKKSCYSPLFKSTSIGALKVSKRVESLFSVLIFESLQPETVTKHEDWLLAETILPLSFLMRTHSKSWSIVSKIPRFKSFHGNHVFLSNLPLSFENNNS